MSTTRAIRFMTAALLAIGYLLLLPPTASSAAAGIDPDSLPKVLEAKEGFLLRHSHDWIQVPGYSNAYKLKRMPIEALGTQKAHEAPQIMITTEVRSDHAEALMRLREIDASEDAAARFVVVRGWPALEREYLAPMDRIGPARRQQQSTPLSRRFTLAVAVGNLVVHLQGHLMPEADPAIVDEMRAMGHSFVFENLGDPLTSESEINALQQAPRLMQAPRALQADPQDSSPDEDAANEHEADGPGLVQRVQGGPGDGVDAEIEVAVSTDGQHVIVVNNGRDFATSNDGGKTFTTVGTLPSGAPGGGSNGDPSIAYAAGGNFYFAYIGFPDLADDGNGNFIGNQCSTAIASSSDNGQNFAWVSNAELCDDTSGDPCFPDQEHIAADRYNLSLNTGLDQVYSTWRNFDGGGCGRFGGIAIAGPDVPSLMCSEDDGATWSARIAVHNSDGTYPRITVGQDSSVYVVFREGSNNIRLAKYSSCSTGLIPLSNVAVATGISRVTCPIPGIDRCNNGSDLSSQMVAVDDTDANHVYVSYAVSTAAGINENVVVLDSVDGGVSWIRPAVQVNNGILGRRFMPWVCSVGGDAYVSWYDMRASSVLQNDLTDYYGGSAFLNDSGDLTAGSEFEISNVTDDLCAPSPGYWPCSPRSSDDSESCADQPQLAGLCVDANGDRQGGADRCDFSQTDVADNICADGFTCQTGGGCPKYGDYSGNACGAGRFYTAWASRNSPANVDPPSNDVDVFFSSKIVCCEPQIQVPAPVVFAESCDLDALTETLEVCNTGVENLEVDAIDSSDEQFFVTDPSSGYPVVISADFCFPFEVNFEPTGSGEQSAVLTIVTNDTVNPTVDVDVSGDVAAATIETFIADNGEFGEVCSGLFHDLDLTIQNDGTCDLTIDSVALSGADAGDFELPSGSYAGTVIEAGNSLLVPVRFAPDNFTDPSPRSASVDVMSSSANGDALPLDATPISGTVPPPDINVAIANSGNFGQVCTGGFADLDLTLFNQGRCDLTIASITSSNSVEFILPSDTTYPLVLSHDAEFTLPVRYQPTACGAPEGATITITSDDPDEGSVAIGVSGEAPCPNLVIDPPGLEGVFAFPATVVDETGSLGCFSDRSTVLRNTGACPLTISDVSATAADFSVLAPSQFPIVLPPGEETLEVSVRFTPQGGGDPLTPTEITGLLTVLSDDPDGAGMAALCGEGAEQSGVRILVTDISSGFPVLVDSVDDLRVVSKGKHTPSPINIRFTDQPWDTTEVCGNTIEWHANLETLPSTDTTGGNPKSSYLAKAKEGNLAAEESFGLGQCEFREFQLQLWDSDSDTCVLLPKGDPCSLDAECCSGRCRGPAGGKVCK